MLEKDLQVLFIKKVKNAGGLAYKVDSPSGKGFPDLVVVLDCKLHLVEMKNEKGKLSLHQKLIHEELCKHGIHVTVLSSPAEMDQFILDWHYDPN